MSQACIPPNVIGLARGEPIDHSFRINVHFHPDIPYKDVTVIQSLVSSKQYFSQFVTGISNGRVIETPSDDCIIWETELFSGFYDQASPGTQRPKYGSLGFLHDLYRSSPRFGSCYFRLKQQVLDRTTFCYPESAIGPQAFGTSKCFGLLSLARETSMTDRLDWYIEAHIHGPIRIPEDVESLVLDPSYLGTTIEATAYQLGCEIIWHAGYEIVVSEMREHEDYRGAWVVDVAEQLSDVKGRLTPRALGKAHKHSPYGKQKIKKVWHYLARFGRRQSWPDTNM